ncbi:hypothetical protein EMIT0196MI5_160051 [Pseudomonas sp. IT-196MI5]
MVIHRLDRCSTFYGEKGLAGSLKVGTRELRSVLVFASDRDNMSRRYCSDGAPSKTLN